MFKSTLSLLTHPQLTFLRILIFTNQFGYDLTLDLPRAEKINSIFTLKEVCTSRDLIALGRSGIKMDLGWINY